MTYALCDLCQKISHTHLSFPLGIWIKRHSFSELWLVNTKPLGHSGPHARGSETLRQMWVRERLVSRSELVPAPFEFYGLNRTLSPFPVAQICLKGFQLLPDERTLTGPIFLGLFVFSPSLLWYVVQVNTRVSVCCLHHVIDHVLHNSVNSVSPSQPARMWPHPAFPNIPPHFLTWTPPAKLDRNTYPPNTLCVSTLVPRFCILLARNLCPF